MAQDNPNTRELLRCPLCGASKPQGNVVCWPTRKEIEAEFTVENGIIR